MSYHQGGRVIREIARITETPVGSPFGIEIVVQAAGDEVVGERRFDVAGIAAVKSIQAVSPTLELLPTGSRAIMADMVGLMPKPRGSHGWPPAGPQADDVAKL